MLRLNLLRIMVIIFMVAVINLSYSKLELRDPTRPSGAKLYKLSMIVTSSGHYLAVINGKTVKVGENINGAVVKVIGHEHVVLETKKGKITVRIAPNIKN